jgi:hypothetical protein
VVLELVFFHQAQITGGFKNNDCPEPLKKMVGLPPGNQAVIILIKKLRVSLSPFGRQLT